MPLLTSRTASLAARPFTALLISDGRTGHRHLAEGVIAAIARRRPVEIVCLDLRRYPWAPGRYLAALINSGAPPEFILQLGYGIKAEGIPATDLVVSAGGDTLAANVSAARILGVPNIFYGSLRRFRPEDFALVLTSYACNTARPRHVVTLKPSPFDPDMFARSASSQKKARAEAPATAGLLVGANTAAVRYRDQDWSLLIDFLRRLQASRGTRWIVSNSRRTPRRLTGRFARLAEEAQSPVASFIDVRTAGSGTLLPLFANSDAVIATVDSSSMVSEAIWARRPVIAVAPAETRLSDAEQEYRAFLEAQGWLRTIAISDLKIERVLAALSEMKPLNANPLDLLAETLFERLPGLLESPSR